MRLNYSHLGKEHLLNRQGALPLAGIQVLYPPAVKSGALKEMETPASMRPLSEALHTVSVHTQEHEVKSGKG